MILTAYFSHSGENYFSGRIVSVEKGNTAVVAEKIAAMTGCDLFEIRRKEPYPDKYSDCVKEAVSEMKSAARPDLCENVDISAYDVVILGYPNWCGTMPAPVFTFLEINDFSGKRMLPFCTNEGSGLGKSVADIKTLCPSAHVGEGLSVRGGSVQDCDAELKTWLEKKTVSSGREYYG